MALEPHYAVFFALKSGKQHQWDQYQERAALPVRTQCSRKFANSLPRSGQTLSHYHPVIKELQVSVALLLPPHWTTYRRGIVACRERGKKTINLTFNQPSSAPASRFSLCLCLPWTSLLGRIEGSRIGINKYFYTKCPSFDWQRQALSFSHYLRLLSCISEANVFPNSTFLEVIDCHMVS